MDLSYCRLFLELSGRESEFLTDTA